MISFDQQGIRFKYRVPGLAVNNGYVLLTKADQDEYWILRREILEESGQKARIGNLLWIFETFFDLDGTDYHELAFVYAFSPTDPSILDNTWIHRTTDGDTRIELPGSTSTTSKPSTSNLSFLKGEPQHLPATPQHVIVKEPVETRADR